MDDLEYWLKGAVPEIPLLLQPVAHALLQVQKELKEVFIDFDEKKLWERPRNVASLGFLLITLLEFWTGFSLMQKETA
jgi:hypothetical protein